ncbi:MAG: Glu-tRNA(Gln) amidotransferase subunit GatD [Nanoarchaeota archaeon]|nr:Glu-tRNA(Gln) amidotransferase subunit GatD [Nanoarchaeota archaeon]
MIKVNNGDLIQVHTLKEIYEGIYLPSPETGIFLLKMENGYNIGFNKKEVIKIKIKKRFKEIKEDVEIPEGKSKKNIAMIILGGTIASRLNPGKGGVDSVETPEDLFKYYPELFDKVNVSKVVSPFQKDSSQFYSKDWQKVTKEIIKFVNDGEISGILVTQGTDTLHYTSAALSFFLRDLGKPVVLTYSQRSIDRGSSDARLNLTCAAQVCLFDCSGVFVVGHANLNDDFCYAINGTKVRKLHSSRRDAFKSINEKPLFKIYEDKLEIISSYKKRNKSKCILDNKFEEKVGLLKFYPGQNPEILDYYVEKGYKGLVIEAFGLGQIATSGAHLNWTKKLKEVQKKGLVICITSQTIFGRVDPMVYITGRELKKTGVIFLEDMHSETAFVKLGWVLGHKDWDVKEKMLENISGEFNKRIEI